MKTKSTSLNLMRGTFAMFALACIIGTISFAAEEPTARITAVRVEGTNVVVDVEASADFTKVTLESSTRLGRRAWLPRGVKLIPGGAAVANATFTVPLSPEIEILRVRGDRVQDTLP